MTTIIVLSGRNTLVSQEKERKRVQVGVLFGHSIRNIVTEVSVPLIPSRIGSLVGSLCVNHFVDIKIGPRSLESNLVKKGIRDLISSTKCLCHFPVFPSPDFFDCKEGDIVFERKPYYIVPECGGVRQYECLGSTTHGLDPPPRSPTYRGFCHPTGTLITNREHRYLLLPCHYLKTSVCW